MNIKQIFQFRRSKKIRNYKLSIDRIAAHEAAHGLIWSFFYKNWDVHKLSIERSNLPDSNMDGALHITAISQKHRGVNTIQANEVTAIALAGLIGQNMNVLMQDYYLMNKVAQTPRYLELLDTTGCAGDFDIVRRFSSDLGDVFSINEGAYLKYKILDLINIFQSHTKVQSVHQNLTDLLLIKKTIMKGDLITFFKEQKFFEYIYEEDLDTSFFNR